jgi:CMP-N-acetylneuraminic acid synthetase
VSTDSDEYGEIALKYGAKVIKRRRSKGRKKLAVTIKVIIVS